MKTINLIIIILFTTAGFSQNEIKSSSSKTTFEEYNFLTKSYGLADNATMLDGYELQSFLHESLGKFTYNYELFVELSTGNIKAMFITITKIKKKDDKVRYLCMPINNGQLFKKFYSETEGLGITMSMGFEAMNAALLSKLMDEKFNIEQKND